MVTSFVLCGQLRNHNMIIKVDFIQRISAFVNLAKRLDPDTAAMSLSYRSKRISKTIGLHATM